jgi:hypothetical protein
MKCPKCNKRKMELSEYGLVYGGGVIVDNGTIHPLDIDDIQHSSIKSESYNPQHVEAKCLSCGCLKGVGGCAGGRLP